MLRRSAALAGICCIGGLIAGCGSSSSLSHPPATTVQARQTPLNGNADVGRAQQQSSHPAAALGQLPPGARSTVHSGRPHVTTAKVVQARPTPASANDDVSASGAKTRNPCKLVTLSQAQTITGGAITRLSEAPLGPTCIYSGQGRSASVTLAVETESFGKVTRHMTARKHLLVRGHRSVCGRLGAQMLFVPLGRYQLLNVTAPCGIAQRFAAVAVSSLSA